MQEFKLTIEQQLDIQMFEQTVKGFSLQDTQAALVECYRLSIFKENAYKQLIKIAQENSIPNAKDFIK